MTTDPDTFAATALLVGLRNIPVPRDADPNGLLLRSEDIGSKFGFHDGDAPDPVQDMAETYFGGSRYIDNAVWHPVLMNLIQTRLLPALGNPDADVYRLNTCHNPVRLRTPLPPDFPHGQVYVDWLEVFTHVIARMPDGVEVTDCCDDE